MIKKIIMCLVMVCGYVNCHHECVVCARRYESKGEMNNFDTPEDFWRFKEMACERHLLDALRDESKKTSPRLGEEPSSANESLRSSLLSKLPILKRLSSKKT